MSKRIGIKTALTFALAAVLLLAAFAAPAPASAGLLTTGTATECDPNIAQVFRPWGDSAYYRPAPGGSFDSGPSWSLAGGARVVTGNEPYKLMAGTRSLYLPAGSTATSPAMCFSWGDWHARFMVRNPGAAGRLEVDILVRSLLGVVSVLDGGTVRADGTWDPSPEMSALLTNLGGLLSLTKSISFRLEAKGTGAQFQVDSVFLDPFRSR